MRPKQVSEKPNNMAQLWNDEGRSAEKKERNPDLGVKKRKLQEVSAVEFLWVLREEKKGQGLSPSMRIGSGSEGRFTEKEESIYLREHSRK